MNSHWPVWYFIMAAKKGKRAMLQFVKRVRVTLEIIKGKSIHYKEANASRPFKNLKKSF